jgi:hypothetical protein
LNLTYTSVAGPTRYETWYSSHFPTAPPGTYLNPAGDDDGDLALALVEYAINTSPLARNVDPLVNVVVTDDTINTTFSASFRRDPRATDLTYEFQVSEDLINWTTEAISTAGAVATSTGTASVGEIDVFGEAPMKWVNVTAELSGLDARTSARLKITRTP